MGQCFRGLLFVFIPVLLSQGALAADLSPSAVLKNPSQYDGQKITVTGTVSGFRTHVSHRGNAYETFKLCDASACLSVFAWGTDPRDEGATISASGKFWTVKREERYVFYNKLDLD